MSLDEEIELKIWPTTCIDIIQNILCIYGGMKVKHLHIIGDPKKEVLEVLALLAPNIMKLSIVI